MSDLLEGVRVVADDDHRATWPGYMRATEYEAAIRDMHHAAVLEGVQALLEEVAACPKLRAKVRATDAAAVADALYARDIAPRVEAYLERGRVTLTGGSVDH